MQFCYCHSHYSKFCLLYTSDAADDLTRVDLGGCRIIKKKKNDSEQAAMLDDELLAKYAPDDKQRFNQLSQVGQVRDQLLDARLELHLPDHPDLEAEVAQSTA